MRSGTSGPSSCTTTSKPERERTAAARTMATRTVTCTRYRSMLEIGTTHSSPPATPSSTRTVAKRRRWPSWASSFTTRPCTPCSGTLRASACTVIRSARRRASLGTISATSLTTTGSW
uniref:(northern house mosquito) hypothetical protein n=1 Tax=Culex pipiens TaxID=7175 RepID=A0A8D8JK14_CULPI